MVNLNTKFSKDPKSFIMTFDFSRLALRKKLSKNDNAFKLNKNRVLDTVISNTMLSYDLSGNRMTFELSRSTEKMSENENSV